VRVLLVADAKSQHSRRWATALVGRGASVHVATLRPADPIPGAEMHVLPTFGLGKAGYLLAIPALRRLVRRLAPDAVHAHYVTSYGFLAAAAHAPRLIVTAWGSDVLGPASRRRAARYFTRLALRRADVVTTVAEHMNAHALEIAGRPIEIEAVPFGVDLTQFEFAPRAPERGASDGAVRVICTRNFHPLYDVTTVVQAFADFAATTSPSPTLTLIGNGPQRNALQALAQARGVSERVRFLGHIPAAALARELAAADVFVTPAHSDGNNVSLNEAMAVGPFPIGTAIPANEQWINHGENGLLYPPGDVAALATALTRATEMRPRWTDVARGNRAIVQERANWTRSVDHALGLYQRLLEQAQ